MTTMQEVMTNRIKSLQVDLNYEFHERFSPFKKDVIDYAFNQYPIHSVAELGCVWGVDGAYGRYIHDKYPQVRLCMVDIKWNDSSRQMSEVRSRITEIEGDFSNVEMPKRLGTIDMVVLFDILLHMVSPNWDELLRMYAGYTNYFLIVNPQFFSSDITVRLNELGQEKYFELVPHGLDEPLYSKIFSDPLAIDVKGNRHIKDSFNIWQWGITNHDLIDKLDRLGFELVFLQMDSFEFDKKGNFKTCGFLFRKKSIKNSK